MKSFVETPPLRTDEVAKLVRYGVICALLWTVMVSVLFAVYFEDNRQVVHEIGHNMARASFEKDILFRRWAARHGGVYVPETAETPASPYLSHIAERDITTPSGRRLTLMNPAYMTRQIFEQARENPDNPQGHITSLNPIRAENSPDDWERRALNALEKGAKEVVEPVVMMNGQPYLRLMRSLATQKPCLKCHAAQGYKEGDVRGGISVTLSLAPIQQAMNSEMHKEIIIHSLTWLAGLGIIWFGTRKIIYSMTLLRDERNNLKEAEDRYRALFARASDGIFILSTDGRIMELNESLARMHGYSVDEMRQMGLKDLDTPETSSLAPARMQRLLAGESLTFEVEHYHKDGHVFPLEVSASLVSSGGESFIQCFHRDITERKLAEARLAESESHLRTIIDNEPECIKIMDAQGLLLQMNPAGLKMIEAETLEQVTGLPVIEVIAPEYREAYAELQKRVIAGEAMQMKYEVLGLKGGRRWVETHAVPMQANDTVVHLAVTRDISEQKRSEEERFQLEQQFHHAQKLESLGVLAGGIAHDFNNILTVILGHCYMASEDFSTEQEFKASFQQVETAALRAADLCRQMLTYAGRIEFVQTRFSLWLLVEEVVKMLQSAIKKNVSIELDLNRDVPDIKGDIGQIQQVVMNLIINAAESIGDSNGTVKVGLTKTVIQAGQVLTDAFGTIIQAGSYVCLEIADSGCGMDEETQKRVFEPFFSTKFTGRGLGMSAIRGIVKSHESILQMTSTPGVGTTFHVYFPVPEVYDDVEPAPSRTVLSNRVGGKVLLVDDEEVLNNMGASLLGAMGFSVITAHNGKEALEVFRERGNEIDLILLDLIMPVMGGLEAYQQLRAMAQAVPIIICSGYGAESVADVIKDDQNAGFANKPYRPDQLRNLMMEMMNRNIGTGDAQ